MKISLLLVIIYFINLTFCLYDKFPDLGLLDDDQKDKEIIIWYVLIGIIIISLFLIYGFIIYCMIAFYCYKIKNREYKDNISVTYIPQSMYKIKYVYDSDNQE